MAAEVGRGPTESGRGDGARADDGDVSRSARRTGEGGNRGSGRGSDGGVYYPPRTMAETFERLQDWLKSDQPKSTGEAGNGDAARPADDQKSSTGQRAGRPALEIERAATPAATKSAGTKSTGSQAPARKQKDAASPRETRELKRVAAGAAGALTTGALPAPAGSAAAPTGEQKVEQKAAARAVVVQPAVLPPAGTFLPNEIVAYGLPNDAITRLAAKGLVSSAGAASGLLGAATIVRLPPGFDEAVALGMIRREAPDAASSFNRVYRPFRPQGAAATPPRAIEPVTKGTCPPSRCFGSQAVGWRPAIGDCAREVAIGVIDTPVDQTHPAFANGRLVNAEFRRDGSHPAANWHGTGVLALLAGAPESGTPGLVPRARFLVADVFYAGSDGSAVSDTASLVRALDWMNKSGVKVINMSFAGPRDEIMERAIVALAAKGVVMVGAAGNDGPASAPLYPAAYDEVIAVTAVDRDNRNYRYANRGAYVDLAAPGVDVWTAVPGGRGGLHSGTSFAAPYVTATVAALYTDVPRKTKSTFLDALPVQDLGPPGRDAVYGRGLLQAPATCRGGPPSAWSTVATPGAPARPVEVGPASASPTGPPIVSAVSFAPAAPR